MRQIANGKLYDTDRAELVYTWTRQNFVFPDANNVTCSIYRTKKGNYFLHSHWSMGNENISALRSDKLIEDLGCYLGTEKLLRLFPDKIEEG